MNANGNASSFNTATNWLLGYVYDAAGNQVTDAQHTYVYDAEGKVVQVDGGSTAQYAYDAMDYRVRITMQGKDNEFLFDPFGRRQSTWLVAQNFGSEGKIYWDYGLLANRGFNGQTTYHHTNYLGTERTRTNYQGLTSATETSGPFGENLNEQNNANLGNASEDNNQYTGQEHDPESNTEHFQYRQYTSRLGHWISPDPYAGSYDLSSPQSLNRYEYASNSPLVYIDPNRLSDKNDIPVIHISAISTVIGATASSSSFPNISTIDAFRDSILANFVYTLGQFPITGFTAGRVSSPKLASPDDTKDPCYNKHLAAVGVGPQQLRNVSGRPILQRLLEAYCWGR